MQGKVSMVMPCYNKVNYIGEMLDSIIAQKWDNIELILINDGSTDGTYEVIAQYEPKLRKRGFDVVIIDQKNAGVCAAANAGIKKVTGDYICCIDADDELDPEYVCTMAGWLESNKEYDYCVCDRVSYTGKGTQKKFKKRLHMSPPESSINPLVLWLLKIVNTPVWPYIIRRDYFEKCQIARDCTLNREGSHEPMFAVPLLSNNGKYKVFSQALYRFNISEEQTHSRGDIDHSITYYTHYTKLVCDEIDRLGKDIANNAQKLFYKNLCEFAKRYSLSLLEKNYDRQSLEYIFQPISSYLRLDLIIKNALKYNEVSLFVLNVKKLFVRQSLTVPACKRIVAYGVLGYRGKKYLPILYGTKYEPNELWDINADGINVVKPDLSKLKSDDLVIVFPKNLNLDFSPAQTISVLDILTIITFIMSQPMSKSNI